MEHRVTSPDFLAHDSLMRELRVDDPKAVLDGAVDESIYAAVNPRILWVLREVHSDEAWDLREFLRCEEQLFKAPQWASTYGVIVRASYGMLRGCIPWGACAEVNAREIASELRSIAVINLKKTGGGSSVDWSDFPSACERFRPVVQEQIRLLAPDIIVAAGTGDMLPEDLIGARVLRPYHPGQTRVTHEKYYEWLLAKLAAGGEAR